MDPFQGRDRPWKPIRRRRRRDFQPVGEGAPVRNAGRASGLAACLSDCHSLGLSVAVAGPIRGVRSYVVGVRGLDAWGIQSG